MSDPLLPASSLLFFSCLTVISFSKESKSRFPFEHTAHFFAFRSSCTFCLQKFNRWQQRQPTRSRMIRTMSSVMTLSHNMTATRFRISEYTSQTGKDTRSGEDGLRILWPETGGCQLDGSTDQDSARNGLRGNR